MKPFQTVLRILNDPQNNWQSIARSFLRMARKPLQPFSAISHLHPNIVQQPPDVFQCWKISLLLKQLPQCLCDENTLWTLQNVRHMLCHAPAGRTFDRKFLLHKNILVETIFKWKLNLLRKTSWTKKRRESETVLKKILKQLKLSLRLSCNGAWWIFWISNGSLHNASQVCVQKFISLCWKHYENFPLV